MANHFDLVAVASEMVDGLSSFNATAITCWGSMGSNVDNPKKHEQKLVFVSKGV